MKYSDIDLIDIKSISEYLNNRYLNIQISVKSISKYSDIGKPLKQPLKSTNVEYHHLTQNFDPHLFRSVPGPVEAILASKMKEIIERVVSKIKNHEK